MGAAHPSLPALNNLLGKNVSCTIFAEFFKCSKSPFSAEVPETLKILVLFLSIFYFNEFLSLPHTRLWHRLPSASRLNLGTKGVVTRPKCSFVKHLSALCYACGSCLSLWPRLNLNLRPAILAQDWLATQFWTGIRPLRFADRKDSCSSVF